jgi:hypothetical protein
MLYFVGRPRNEVMGSMEHSQICWEKSNKNIPEGLHTVLGCIHNL